LPFLKKNLALMFKLFLPPRLAAWANRGFFARKTPVLCALALLSLTVFNGCFTAPPLPKVNLSEPGWNIREGQAVWRPDRKSPELAGDLIVATRADGSAFAQFTKTPFPFAIAQLSSNEWQIEFPPRNLRFAAHGKPPARIVWFQLLDALNGKPVAKNWTWQGTEANWTLTNLSSGESLEGYLNQ
jgi:hypothetical protein